MAKISYDFETIKNKLVNTIKRKLTQDPNEKIQFNYNSAIMRIAEAFAEELSELAGYSSYLLRESKWSLSQNTSSVMTQLDLFGYKPHRKIGANGDVEVSTSENFSKTNPYPILIPKWTKFSDGTIDFHSKESVILKDAISTNVSIIQGELKELEFTGNDIGENDMYRIFESNIENSLYEVYKNGELMEEISYWGENSLNVSSENQNKYNNSYIMKNSNDFSNITLQFYPFTYNPNDTFKIKYLNTNGSETNISQNTITQIYGEFKDENNNDIKLYCRNNEPIANGLDYETIDEMKRYAPLAFSRNESIVTKNDYKRALHDLFGSDYHIVVKTEDDMLDIRWNEISEWNYQNHCRIFVSGFVLDRNDKHYKHKYKKNIRLLGNFNTEQNYEMLKSLNRRKSLTDYFILQDTKVYKYYIQGIAFYKENEISRNILADKIDKHLAELNNSQNSDYGISIYNSDSKINLNGISDVRHYNTFPWICIDYLESDYKQKPQLDPTAVIHTEYDLFEYIRRNTKIVKNLYESFDYLYPLIKDLRKGTIQINEFLQSIKSGDYNIFTLINNMFNFETSIKEDEKSVNVNYAVPTDESDRLINYFIYLKNSILTLSEYHEWPSSAIHNLNALELLMNISYEISDKTSQETYRSIFGKSYDEFTNDCLTLSSHSDTNLGLISKFNSFVQSADEYSLLSHFMDLNYDLFTKYDGSNPTPDDEFWHSFDDFIAILKDKETWGEIVGKTQPGQLQYSGKLRDVSRVNTLKTSNMTSSNTFIKIDIDEATFNSLKDTDPYKILFDGSGNIKGDNGESYVIYQNGELTATGMWKVELFADPSVEIDIRIKYPKEFVDWTMDMFDCRFTRNNSLQYDKKTFPSDPIAILNEKTDFYTDITNDHSLPESMNSASINYDGKIYSMMLDPLFRFGDYYISSVDEDGNLIEDLFLIKKDETELSNPWKFYISCDLNTSSLSFDDITKTATPINTETSNISFSTGGTINETNNTISPIVIQDESTLLKMFAKNEDGNITDKLLNLVIRCVPSNNDLIPVSDYQIWQWIGSDTAYPFQNPWDPDSDNRRSEYFRIARDYRGIYLKNE